MKLSEHFSRSEFACRCGCGFDTVDHELIVVLEDVRSHFGKPVKINSGARCKNHNESIGGSEGSMHLLGKAADFVVQDIHADMVAEYLEYKYPMEYGLGRYDGRTHIDVRKTSARWDKR